MKMENKLLLLIFLTALLGETQGFPNNVAAVVSEVPVAVGYRGPCNPNPCGSMMMCEVQGGAALCKPDLNEFFGGRNVTSTLSEGLPPAEDPEAEAAPAVLVTDAPIQAVAAEEYDSDIVPIAGEPNAPINDAPIRPVTAKPTASLVGQLGPIAETRTSRPFVPFVPFVPDPVTPGRPVAGFKPVEEGPKAVTAYMASSVTSAPVAPIAAPSGVTGMPPISEMREAPINDAPIRPVTAKPAASLVGQLGPIAETRTSRPFVPFVPFVPDPVTPGRPVAGFEPVAEGPKAVTSYMASSVTSAPVAPIAAPSGVTGMPPISEMRENQVSDAPIVPIAATPDAIVNPPPIAEYPEGTAEPPPEGRDSSAGWGFKYGPCDGNPCGPNTKCSVAPNGMPRCRCMEDFVPNENTIVGCKPNCMSNEECPGDYYCKASKCARVCGPGSCGLKADCDGYQNRAICNCPEGYEGDPYIQCDRVWVSNSTGGAATGRFVVLDINNDITQELDDEPVRVVYMDTGKDVTPEERVEALEILEEAKQVEAALAAAEAEKLVGEENNAMRECVSSGLMIMSVLLIRQL